MKNHDFNSILVSDGTAMEMYAAFPAAHEQCPGIILLQEAFGVNNHIRDVAERFCAEGYAVIAPDLFHRTVNRFEGAYDDFPAVMPHFQAINNEDLSLDLKAAFDWLINQDNVVKDKVGSIGFCLGGRVSFLANTILPLSAAVSFYGGGLESMTDLAVKLHSSHLFFWGGLDKHITEAKRNLVINALISAGKDFTNVIISHADHAFFCNERGSYNPVAAKEAWAHTLAFFENRLK